MIANKSLWCSLVISIVLLAISAHADFGIAAITNPSADVTLSFVLPGRIAEVHVKEGDRVKPGKILVQQDDAADQAQLIQIKAQSEDTTQVEAAQASLDQKRIDNWLNLFGLFPELKIHSSGHACGPDIFDMIKKIGPKRVYPIHTEHPNSFKKLDSDIVIVEEDKTYSF